jgi:hypothetical protein
LAWLIALTRITSRLSVNTRMNLFCRLLQATSVVAFLTPDVSHAANLYVKRACALYGCPTVITIGGMISPGDAETFDQLTSANDTKYAVNLDTEGGSILEAQKIAHRIHQLGPIMITSISDGKVCESACVLLFFATDRRFAHSSAVVGLHRAWRPRNGGGYDDAPDGVAMMAKELARDGVSEATIKHMEETPGASMFYLQGDALAREGVTVDDALDRLDAANMSPTTENGSPTNHREPQVHDLLGQPTDP